MFVKRKPIINDDLMVAYRSLVCCLCGGNWQVAGHHHVLRSNKRMDVVENLSPLCVEHHTMWHSSPEQFKKIFGEDQYKQLGEFKDGCTIESIYERYQVD